MSKKTKFLTAAGVIAAALSQLPNDAEAMNPNLKAGFEKCYGVSKAGKNDCASKAEKHGCAGIAKKDNNPNEWVKVPEGLCDKLVGGSTIAASDAGNKGEADDGHGDHKH